MTYNAFYESIICKQQLEEKMAYMVLKMTIINITMRVLPSCRDYRRRDSDLWAWGFMTNRIRNALGEQYIMYFDLT